MSVTTSRPGGLGSMMAGGNPDPARGRSIDDFYPTPPDVTEALMLRYGDCLPDGTIWEPCAGNGVMADGIARHAGSRLVVASDIEPRREGVHRMNVLDWKTGGTSVQSIITNPPFALAEPIIRHVFAMRPDMPFLALVLKSSFWHSVRRYDLFRTHRPFAIHPLLWRPDFQGLGRPTMEIMWCVWRSVAHPSHTPTIYEPLTRPNMKAP